MKQLIRTILPFILLSSFSTFANYQNVESVYCDGKEIPLADGLRIFVDLKKATFGIGQNKKSSRKLCKIVDFYSILTTSHQQTSGSRKVIFQPIQEIGRRSSCQDGIMNFNGLRFESASLTDNSIILENTKDCDSLEYQLSAQ